MTLSEQNNCEKIGFRCGAEGQQVEHEHESPKFGNWVKYYAGTGLEHRFRAEDLSGKYADRLTTTFGSYGNACFVEI